MPIITTGLTVMSSYGNWYLGPQPIRADDESVAQFCTDMGYGTPSTYTSDGGRFANDGGRTMNYFNNEAPISPSGTTTAWVNVFGYDGIVTSITT